MFKSIPTRFLLGLLAGCLTLTAVQAKEFPEKKAVEPGVKYLKQLQQPDGSWPHPKKTGVTALAGPVEIGSRKPLVTITDGAAEITRLAFSPNSMVLAGGGGQDGIIRFWDPGTGKRLKQTLVHGCDKPAPWTNVVFSPDGSLLASVRNGDSTDMRLWDWKAEREVARLDGMVVPTGIAFGPTGKTLAVMDSQHIFLFDIEKKMTIHKLPHKEGGFTSCLSFSPDGKKLAASGAGLSRIRIWNCVKGAEERVLSSEEAGFTGVYWTKDGKRILAIGPGRALSRWDLETGKELNRYPFRGPGVAPVPSVTLAVSPDESIVAIGMQDEMEVWTGPGFKSEFWDTYGLPAFSPNGKLLATTHPIGEAYVITIWDTGVIKAKSK